jgi:hypothetical protein
VAATGPDGIEYTAAQVLLEILRPVVVGAVAGASRSSVGLRMDVQRR